ncbi:MAG: hypothetical protein ACO1OB_31405, partial [Archangium sp.]
MRVLLLCLLLCACDEAGTGGRAVELNVEVRPVVPGVIALEGAEVMLTRAELEFTAVYVIDQPPPTTWLRRILDLGIPSAHAHAGHDFFAGGQVLTEWIHPVTVDLLQPTTTLGRAPGIAGEARSASVLLWPRDGRSLFVEGVVTRGGTASPFSVSVSLEGAPETQRVDFTRAEGSLDDGVTLVVEPTVAAWFSGAVFSDADVGSLAPESQVARALLLNLPRHTAWQVRA